MDDAVNIIGTKASSGEPLFEVTSTKLVHVTIYGRDSGYCGDSVDFIKTSEAHLK